MTPPSPSSRPAEPPGKKRTRRLVLPGRSQASRDLMAGFRKYPQGVRLLHLDGQVHYDDTHAFSIENKLIGVGKTVTVSPSELEK